MLGLSSTVMWEDFVVVVLLAGGALVATSGSAFVLGASVFGSLCFAAIRPIFGAACGVPEVFSVRLVTRRPPLFVRS